MPKENLLITYVYYLFIRQKNRLSTSLQNRDEEEEEEEKRSGMRD